MEPHCLIYLHSQLLDLLLDANSSAQIPGFHRIDLDVPAISAVPGLITDYAEQASQLKFEGEAGKLLQTEIQAMLKERKITKKPPGSGKSLVQMMSSIPHRPLDIIPVELSADLQETESGPPPIAYLHPDQVDDYLWWIDGSLGTPGYPTLAPAVHGQSHSAMKERELSVGNPNSVYNWLRRHEPKIFLQDGEGSEKSSGKPGALRGAGKRASIPAPSKPDQVEFVEEDGIGYEISLGGLPYPKNAKRKREEDTGYRPKGGSSRPSKRKKAIPGEPSKSRSKAKASEASPSPPS